MSKKKSLANRMTRHNVKRRYTDIKFVNFDENTALRVYQVLADLLAEQNNMPKIKLSFQKEKVV